MAVADLLDLVLPRRCAGCGRPGVLLCPACLPAADAVPVATIGGVDVVAAARYEDGVRRALIAYKERGRRELAAPLGTLLTAAVRVIGAGPDVVLVAPPSSRAASAQRGGDHVLRLARRAGPRVLPGALRAIRKVEDSAGLTMSERERNLAGAMVAVPGRGRTAVVVDDIVTTGATLRESLRALRSTGWRVAGCAVVAATPRRHDGFTAVPLAGPGSAV